MTIRNLEKNSSRVCEGIHPVGISGSLWYWYFVELRASVLCVDHDDDVIITY